MAVNDWFDADYYFQSKLAQLGSPWNELTLKKAFADAGYEGEEGLYQHFLDFGNAEGVSPNKYFDANYYVQAKAADYFGVSAEAVTSDQIAFIKKAFADNGMTAWDHYTEYGTTEEIDPSANFDTSVYLTNKLAAWNKEDPLVEHDMAELKAVLKNAGYNAVSHYLDYGRDEEIAIADSAAHGAAAQSLTSDDDILYGTTGSTKLDEHGSVSVNTNYDDVFNAGAGTLGDNDVINGLGGTDTLNAVLINHQNTIQPTLNSVEVVKFQAQESAGSQQATTNYNNITHSQIDAGNISGMTQLWDTDSRATLIVEDVRTDSNKLDLYMQDTDPGDVDFGVYFNPLNLKSDTTSSNDTATLQVMDVKNAQLSGGESPLTEQPFDKFTFDYASTSGTVQVALQFRAADKALYTGKDATYDTLLTAFNNALDDYEAANPSMAGLFEITKGGAFSATTTVKGTTYTSNSGFDVKIAAVGGTIDVVAEGTGWGVQSGNVPSVGGIVWNAVTDPDSTCPLIVTDLYLDNVGKVNWDATPDSDCLPDDVLFGSQAGDVVIGSMADRGGVERINVTVDEGSWLSTLASTNETLRMVTAVNGVVEGVNDKGNLFIGQSLVPTGSDRNLATWADAAKYLKTDGLKDVAVFDAATFEGQINLGASITESSFDKYLKDVDGVNSTTVKDAPLSGYNGEFTYNLGVNNDTLNMKVNGGIAADNDFALAINAGNGNDKVQFAFEGKAAYYEVGGTVADPTYIYVPATNFATDNELADQTLEVVTTATADGPVGTLYLDLANVAINGGAGNDVIAKPGDGSVVIYGGSGNDIIYADNTGALQVNNTTGTATPTAPITSKAVWVLNTNAQASVTDGDPNKAILVSAVNGAQPLDNDLLSVVDTANKLAANGADGISAGTSLVVSIEYMDYTVEANVKTWNSAVASTDVEKQVVLDSEINAAIIAAVKNSDVMNAMLDAKDGAGHSLILESKVDGLKAAEDLAVSFNFIKSDGTTADGGVQWRAVDANDALDENAVVATAGPNAYTSVQLASTVVDPNTGMTAKIVNGANSTAISNNFIAGDAGNDLIILGTGGSVVHPDAGHDIVSFSGSFGQDIVENFTAVATDYQDPGEDLLDFTSYFGTNIANTTGQIVETEDTVDRNTVSYFAAGTNNTINDVIESINGFNAATVTGTSPAANFVFLVSGVTGNAISGANADFTYQVFTASVAANSNDITGAAYVGTVNLAGVPVDDIINVDLVTDIVA